MRRPIKLVGRTLALALRVPQVLWSFLKVERRYIEFFPAVVAFPVVYGLIVLLDRTELSVDTYSSYFQTAAQVIVTLLVAIAIEVRNIHPDLLKKVRPALYLSVSLIALAAVAALVALSPWCPDWLVRHLFGLTTGGGLGAFLAVVFVNFRLLTRKSTKIESGGVLG